MGFKDGKREPDLLGVTNAQLSTRINALTTRVTALETWKTSASALIATLTTKVAALESSGGGASSAELAALKVRMDAIEAKVCPQQNLADPTCFEPRIAKLEADHIPE